MTDLEKRVAELERRIEHLYECNAEIYKKFGGAEKRVAELERLRDEFLSEIEQIRTELRDRITTLESRVHGMDENTALESRQPAPEPVCKMCGIDLPGSCNADGCPQMRQPEPEQRDPLLQEARELLREWAYAPAFADCTDVEAMTKAWLKKLEARDE